MKFFIYSQLYDIIPYMDEELYKRLIRLRDELKETAGGTRAPTVCTDAALIELARLKPKNQDELLCVPGVGRVFAEKYGGAFLEVIKPYLKSSSVKTSLINKEVREVLKSLENRLININKRNKLLYMPRTTKSSIDLIGEADSLAAFKITDFIKRFEKGKRLNILDFNSVESDKFAKDYKRLQVLLRETTGAARENGENNLYVAYPFVIGRMSGESFDIRAPLALFPVELIIGQDSACIVMDPSKDIMYNSSLILSYFKFNNIRAQLPPLACEEPGYVFMNKLIDYYAAVGIKLGKPEGGVSAFKEYTAATFPKFRSGEFHIEENAVLGRFSMFSSSLQRDFDQILTGGRINGLLKNLLDDIDEVDIYSDSEDLGDKPVSVIPSERELNYINEMNISQENAILNIDRGDRLVVQGPPGTGKSQTITSMIADEVNKGKNVLMVSQKKAALDVIYSRLKKLNRYALMVSDVKNKDFFYEQLYKALSEEPVIEYKQSEFDRLSDEVDVSLGRLDALAEKLFYNSKYGAGMYRIYDENVYNRFASADAGVLKLFGKFVPEELLSEGYSSIKEIAAYLDDAGLMSTLWAFTELSEKYPWLDFMREGFSLIQISEIKKNCDEIISEYCTVNSKGPLGRLLFRSRIKKPLKRLLKAYFDKYDRKLIKYFVKEPTELYNSVECYHKYYSAKSVFYGLTPAQRLYARAGCAISRAGGGELMKIVEEVKDFAAYCYISRFESENPGVISALNSFDIAVRDLGLMMDKKRDISFKRLWYSLVTAYKNNISASKRLGEIRRVVEGKRKWSVKRFVEKFGFELFKGVRIWLMTPEAVSEILPLETGLFDLLIFDEASQIYIERGVPAIARAKKVVVAGDHKQLRPSSLGDGRIEYDEDENEELEAALEEESLLDLARFRYPEVLLNYHYRSKYEELIAFSNYAFYKGRLNISPNVDKPSSPPIEVVKVDGLWEDRRNVSEAKKVVELIRDFFLKRKNNETVGVITFNSSQRDLILDMAETECAADPVFSNIYLKETQRTENGEDVGLFIKNIENVQGDERDHIIFSLAYAKNKSGKVVRNYGWLNQAGGENRLNVAVSRAKKKIQIVTSVLPSELTVDDLKNEGPRIFRKYLEYAFAVSGGNTEGAKEVLRSFGNFNTRTYDYNDEFVFDVFKELAAAGLTVERSVGIGGYRIDIAVKDESGKYLLGIECDSNLYSQSAIARERDVHRQRYLEGRGWKLYRVWSPKWWRDVGGEIARIKAAAGLAS